MLNWKRSHYAGDLRAVHEGQDVVLMGWVQKKRNLGALVFVDLRDRAGLAQIIFDQELNKEMYERSSDLKGEYVIAVKGKVQLRENINEQLPTGKIEIMATDLQILSTSEVPPIHIHDDDNAGENLRLKYRYLDLRKPKMQKMLMTRNKISKTVRDYMDEHGFVDVETPVLNKPTPEGARDYLVPSRVNPGKFYALPQSPQIFKQLLMVSGFDRYYQIVKCFRDEDLRADRQPEFTQIDIEMSFVDAEDVMEMNEGLIKRLYQEIKGIEVKTPFRRMSYEEAMERFGSDKPDLRFGMELVNLNETLKNSDFGVFSNAIAEGKVVKAIKVTGGASFFSKKGMKNLEKLAKTYGAFGLAWLKFTAEGLDSPIEKFLSTGDVTGIKEAMAATEDDLILFVADKKGVANTVLGNLRSEIADKMDLIDPTKDEILWITEFPLFEYDEEENRYVAKHHPFTSPIDEDVDAILTEPGRARAKAYDLVINGYEVGGGSIRIHQQGLQEKMFDALGFTKEEANEKFGFLLNAFRYGTPPHGGIAYGLDRLTMIFTGTENIRDVIAFPKTQNATCLMSEAPGEADTQQLEELHIQLIKGE